MTPNRWGIPVVTAALVIAADQLAKLFVLWTLGDGDGSTVWHLVGGWLGFSYVENRGAAFGTLVGFGAVLSVVALAVITGAGVIYARVAFPSAWLALGLGLITGGAVGNVIDRIRLGYVVDFLAVAAFPRFNVADSAITVGVLLLAWRLGWADEASRDEPALVRESAHISTPEPPLANPDGKDR